MSPFPMQAGRTIGSAGDVPNAAVQPVEAATSFVRGRIVRLDANGDIIVHPGGADVVDIYGVSMEGATSGVSDSPAEGANVAKADRNTEFVARAHSAADFNADVSTVDVGDTFGFLNDADGISHVDLDDTTNVVLQVTKVDADLRLLWFKFLESTLQEP